MGTRARGLEKLIFAERKMKRTIANQTILEYQRKMKIKIDMAIQQNKDMNSEINNIKLLKKVCASKLAVLSSQQTKWATDVARMTGNCDYEEVYKNKKEQRGERQGAQRSSLQKRKRTNPFCECTPPPP